MKYTDISTTFSIVKPLFERLSSNLSTVISGYGDLRTFMQTDPKMKGRVEGRFIFSTAGLDHGVGHFQPLSMASIMAPATPFRFCAMQKHLTIEKTRPSRT